MRLVGLRLRFILAAMALLALTVSPLTQPAVALEPDGDGRVIASWTPDSTGETDGLVTDGNTVIGYVQSGVAYMYGNGPSRPPEQPISNLGVTHLRDSEGNLYAIVVATGAVVPEDQNEEEEESGGQLGVLGVWGSSGAAGSAGATGGTVGVPVGTEPGGGTSDSAGGGETPPPDPRTAGTVENGSGVQAEFNCRLGGLLFGACKGGSKAKSGHMAGTSSVQRVDGMVSREFSSTRPHSLLDAFDGWSQLYNGSEKSTITIDPNPIDFAHANLFLSDEDEGRPSMPKALGWTEKMEIATDDLGVDDEVLKTAMTVYQPIERMQYDFLNDVRLRDGYLESGKTVRGVAVMTMGFLDKTVGSGLTAIQQQADQNVMQNLLKQISWSADKMANPDRAQTYRDTDEKVEACLELALKDGQPKKDISKTSRKWVSFNCPEHCGTYKAPPGGRKYRDTNLEWEKLGSGAFSYCACCAQATTELNYLNEEQEAPAPRNGAEPRQFSLVQRALFGTKKALKDGNSKEKEKLEKLASEFIRLYGDYVLHEEGGSGRAGGNAAGEPAAFDNRQRWQYVPPRYSVQRYTAALRNGCRYCKDPDCDIVDQNVQANCPINEDMQLSYGICPALGYIFKNWDRINKATPSQRTAEDVKAWMEASMGHVLTGRSITTMCGLNGNSALCPTGPLGGPMKRFVDAFCDSSSVAAFTRYHSRFSSIILDHLAVNRQITNHDKSLILTLVNRVTEQLAMSQADEAANYAVEGSLSGISISSDRRTVGQIAASTTAAIEGWNDVSSLNEETSKFGAMASAYFGPGSPAGVATGNLDQGEAAHARAVVAADSLMRNDTNTLAAPYAVTDAYGRIEAGVSRLSGN